MFHKLFALSVLTCLVPVSSWAASISLVGAQVYASGADGSNAGAYSGQPYQFSTNSSTAHVALSVNGGGTGISFLLAPGANVFTFAGLSASYPINIVGLNLFFNTTGTSFNPAYAAGVGIPGDLAVYGAAGSGTFTVPVAGTNVQSYNTSGLLVNTTSYSGAVALILANYRVEVTDFQAARAPSGSFTVTLTPVPEPASFVACGGGLLALAAALRRRKMAAGR